LYEPEIALDVEIRTMDVSIVKLALLAPAGTVTLEGTLAAPLLLDSATVAPPAGAALVSVSVPVEDCRPPTTFEGLSVNEDRVGGGRGTDVTVSEADLVTPPYAAEMLIVVDASTALVLTVNDALVVPAATVTLDGTLATAVLLLESVTSAPPAGAAPLSVTVPVEDCTPPTTLVGFSDNEASVGAGGGAGVTVSEADLVAPP
jgi:hypothetical protein